MLSLMTKFTIKLQVLNPTKLNDFKQTLNEQFLLFNNHKFNLYKCVIIFAFWLNF